MKALTLYPEWAWAILHLDKRVENRSKALPKGMAGQLVALHAGKHIGGKKGHPSHMRGINNLRGVASWAGWKPGPPGAEWRTFSRQETRVNMQDFPMHTSSIVAFIRFGLSVRPDTGDLTGWRVPDCHGWPIVEVMRLKEPVPVDRGALGFWEIPAGILQRCREVGTVEDEQLKLFGVPK
jgi:hypothetical protein